MTMSAVHGMTIPRTSVRRNVCNNSKKRKKSCFLDFEKKTLKTLPTYSFTGHSEVVVCELIRLSPTWTTFPCLKGYIASYCRKTRQTEPNIGIVFCSLKVKTLKVSTFIYRHLHEHNQQRFTIRSGILTGNDTRWRTASSGSPLPEWTLNTSGALTNQLWTWYTYRHRRRLKTDSLAFAKASSFVLWSDQFKWLLIELYAFNWPVLVVHGSHAAQYEMPGASRRRGTSCSYDFFSNRITKTGAFFSPLYPRNYPPFSQCKYAFHALPGEVIRLHFNSIRLDKTAAAEHKYMLYMRALLDVR